jgi:hypothetical protein
MNKGSYYLLSISAGYNALLGLLTSFLPEELLLALNVPANPLSILLIQILGAFFIGFAMINYLSKRSLIGGIYNKAIIMGNIAYHCIAAMVFIKFVLSDNLYGEVVILFTAMYLILGAGFLRLNFVMPKAQKA